MTEELSVRAGIKDTLPTIFGYIGIGIAFGVVGKAAGLAPWLVIAMSVFIFAGSAQFITVSMLTVGSPLASIILATFLVNARMILMSMTIANYFKKESLAKNIAIGTLLTDESFALGMNKLNHTNQQLSFAWFNTANIISYVTWLSATVIGVVVGKFIANPQVFGLDFAIVAMFIGLLYLQIGADRSKPLRLQLSLVLVTFALVFLGLIFIPSNLLIIVVTLVGCGVGVMMQYVFY